MAMAQAAKDNSNDNNKDPKLQDVNIKRRQQQNDEEYDANISCESLSLH